MTDLYLLALAILHGGTLVTFNRSIRTDGVAGDAPEVTVIEPT